MLMPNDYQEEATANPDDADSLDKLQFVDLD